MTDDQWIYLQKLLDPIDTSLEENSNISKKHDDIEVKVNRLSNIGLIFRIIK